MRHHMDGTDPSWHAADASVALDNCLRLEAD